MKRAIDFTEGLVTDSGTPAKRELNFCVPSTSMRACWIGGFFSQGQKHSQEQSLQQNTAYGASAVS